MGELRDFSQAWEARHPEVKSHRIQLVLNGIAAKTYEGPPAAPYDQESHAIDKDFWLRDIGRRMLAAVRISQGKPVGKDIMDDYNRLTPEEQEEVIQIIMRQGVN